MAGALNSSVIRSVEAYIEKQNFSRDSISFITVGKKGYEYFLKRGYKIIENLDDIDEAVTTEELDSVTEKIITFFDRGDYDCCVVAYNQFKSTFEQEAVLRQILPISTDELKKTVDEIVPERGKYSEQKEETQTDVYTIEPDQESVFMTLIPFLLQIEIYHGLLEAQASEHSSRMIAMKNASDKAEDLSKELTLSYNKARQSQITSEVSEIIGGIEAMA